MEQLTYNDLHLNLNQRVPDLSTEVVLWVIQADRIPPHMGLSVFGKYYCLKATGPDCGSSADMLLLKLQKKRVTTLLFSILHNEERSIDVFGHYQAAIHGLATCLHPIRDYLSIPKAQTVHELLAELAHKNMLHSYYGIRIEDHFKGIPFYTKADVESHLLKLSFDE